MPFLLPCRTCGAGFKGGGGRVMRLRGKGDHHKLGMRAGTRRSSVFTKRNGWGLGWIALLGELVVIGGRGRTQ